ncbi:hypothetical protein AVANS_0735 [Campylobacter sp. RM5004]|uniref:hypothetical protein n=1 Tax=Campylobacter sp. RM5004 TaxID=1660078 RepID=UPI001EFAE519|nr:hypothetical protein [Campylobacter sp. RM5004]ULO01365.1 hypothetical protein AVANS_0735 [Campylobacter sp. RM5004]
MANDLKLEDLISTQRLSYYKDINEHFDNLIFISKLTPKIATIEICIRNIFDMHYPKDWIIQSQDSEIQKQVKIIQHRYKNNNNINHEQYLSNLTFGSIVYLIKSKGLKYHLFFNNVNIINFKDYSNSNKKYYKTEKRPKNKFTDQDVFIIILNLLVEIRNRSYHWENMLKTKIDINNSNKILPRISTNIRNTTIGIMPEKIITFLDDVLDMINPNIKQFLNIQKNKRRRFKKK